MTLSRRDVLKGIAVAGAAAAVGPSPALGRERKAAPPEAHGLLYDATLCVGCKACVVACKEYNKMPPERPEGGLYDAPDDLSAKTRNLIALYRGEDGRRSYMKKQCMHCIDPACASVCMMGAYRKRPLGAVTWDGSRCIGCRNCMVACHYNIPKFEWDSPVPKMVKCELCAHVAADGPGPDAKPTGKLPGCAAVCPRKAVVFGRYDALKAEAAARLEGSPGRYEPKVYGLSEVGGTQVLYLSAAGIPYDRLGLVEMGDEPIPELTETVQHGLYQGFVAPVVLYGALAAVLVRNRRRGDGSGEGSG